MQQLQALPEPGQEHGQHACGRTLPSLTWTIRIGRECLSRPWRMTFSHASSLAMSAWIWGDLAVLGLVLLAGHEPTAALQGHSMRAPG